LPGYVKEADLNGEWIDIIAPSKEHAERLAAAVGNDFTAEVFSDGEHVVRVTPDSESAAKLVNLFNAIGTWLTDAGLSSCDVRFGESSLSILPPSAGRPGDPTAFLLERARQLEGALVTRIVIEQAKGILAERHRIGIEEAFERLRSQARGTGRNIHEVAEEIIRSVPGGG
jgi:ANTAR domain